MTVGSHISATDLNGARGCVEGESVVDVTPARSFSDPKYEPLDSKRLPSRGLGVVHGSGSMFQGQGGWVALRGPDSVLELASDCAVRIIVA